jgi:hypothetical protein
MVNVLCMDLKLVDPECKETFYLLIMTALWFLHRKLIDTN